MLYRLHHPLFPGLEREERGHDGGIDDVLERPNFKVFCPCRKCAEGDKPSMRFLSIVDDHIKLYNISEKYQVITRHTNVVFVCLFVF